MIVDPDFLDHWRTGMVADALGDAMAPIYILRLWAHCQERKSDTFILPTRGLKAQCKFPGDAEAFESALTEAGFISRDGDTIKVVGWAEKNASLLASWENGSRGGRPKNQPQETQTKPMGNPRVTHGQPSANPDETDKSREEKNSPSLRSGEGRGKRAAPPPERPDGVSEQVWSDWIALRAKKRAPVTATVLAEAIREAEKAVMSLDRFLTIWCARGSQGLEASWLKDSERAAPRAPPESFRERDQRLAKERYEEAVGIRKPVRTTPAEVIDVTPRLLDR